MARLVVVDATEWVLGMLADALREAGHDVVACTSAAQAIAAVHTEKPDCVVCDAELPERDGAWVVKRIRAEVAPVNATPIILVSTHAATIGRVEALKAGADAHVTKPYHASEVLQQVDALVRMRSRLDRTRAVASSPPPGNGPASALTGAAKDVNVSTLLAIFEVERKTGLFTVTAGARKAELELARGVVTAARLDGEESDAIEVVNEMLHMGGRFQLTPRADPVGGAPPHGFSLGALVTTAEQRAARTSKPDTPSPSSVEEVQVEDVIEDENTFDIEPDLSSYRPPS